MIDAQRIEPIDQMWIAQAQRKLDQLTKPQGSLGRLEWLAQQICGITRSLSPSLRQKAVITIAADHGVVEEGVSAYPQAVTAQMVLNFLRGGAGINVLARHVGARVIVADLGVAEDLPPHPELVSRKIGRGTRNFSREAAMTREHAEAAINAGIELAQRAIDGGADILGTGDMGIGNTTSSSAIAAAMTGAAVEQITGRGTGIDDATHARKCRVIREALERHRPDPTDALGVLAAVGGFEIGGIAGVILGAAAAKRPVIVDGFISGAGALIAAGLQPNVRGYMIASHLSQEPGHRILLTHLGLEPILDLNLRLGEGTGAALAMSIADAACKLLTEMATFEDAGVSRRCLTPNSQKVSDT